jgi:hypothetical protein
VTNDRQKNGVVGQANNQVPTLGPTHEQRHVHTISEHLLKKNQTHVRVNNSPKKHAIG